VKRDAGGEKRIICEKVRGKKQDSDDDEVHSIEDSDGSSRSEQREGQDNNLLMLTKEERLRERFRQKQMNQE